MSWYQGLTVNCESFSARQTGETSCTIGSQYFPSMSALNTMHALIIQQRNMRAWKFNPIRTRCICTRHTISPSILIQIGAGNRGQSNFHFNGGDLFPQTPAEHSERERERDTFGRAMEIINHARLFNFQSANKFTLSRRSAKSAKRCRAVVEAEFAVGINHTQRIANKPCIGCGRIFSCINWSLCDANTKWSLRFCCTISNKLIVKCQSRDEFSRLQNSSAFLLFKYNKIVGVSVRAIFCFC
jgi:hypothetical protein